MEDFHKTDVLFESRCQNCKMETKKVWSCLGPVARESRNLFMFEMESKFPLNVNSKVCSLRTQMQSLHRFLTGPRIYGFNFHLSASLWIPAPQMKIKWDLNGTSPYSVSSPKEWKKSPSKLNLKSPLKMPYKSPFKFPFKSLLRTQWDGLMSFGAYENC